MTYVTPADCNNPPRWTFISGDPSSDHYAAELAQILKQREPRGLLGGIGGPKLRALSSTIYDQTPLCVVGLVEVIRYLPGILSLKKTIIKDLKAQAAHTVFLFDCPGFNMMLLSKIPKKHRIIYVIPPQLWAWHERRIHTLKKYCQDLWVLYPFEVAFYQTHGLTAQLLRHPLLNKAHLASRPLRPEAPRASIAILPGSRRSEHARLMPYCVALAKAHPSLDWVWVEHQSGSLSEWQDQMPGRIVVGLEALPPVHLAIAASGTVTLELALMTIPSIVIYQVAYLTGLLARYLIKVPYVALPNLLLGTEVYPELLQERLTQAELAHTMQRCLEKSVRLRQYDALTHLRDMFNSASLTLESLADHALTGNESHDKGTRHKT